MKPAFRQIQTLCPELDEKLVREHIRRLGEEYFERFELKHVVKHLQCLSQLSSKRPVEVLLRPDSSGTFECTVLAFDYPSEFSLITGILFGTGANILSGDVFTYSRAPPHAASESSRGRNRRRSRPESLLERRRIIDHFQGSLAADASWERWAATIRNQLEEIVLLLETGDRTSTRRPGTRFCFPSRSRSTTTPGRAPGSRSCPRTRPRSCTL